MTILFDHCVPAPLRRFLAPHEVCTAHELSWQALRSGELIASAEEAGFAVLITADRNWQYQQNLSGRKLAILVLHTNNWVEVQARVAEIVGAVSSIMSGEYREL